MNRLTVLLLALPCLLLGGCWGITRGMLTTEMPASGAVAAIDYRLVPAARSASVAAEATTLVMTAVRASPTLAPLKRHWAANLYFVFCSTWVKPGPRPDDPAVSEVRDNDLLALRLRFDGPPPPGLRPAVDGGCLHLLLGSTALPPRPHGTALRVAFGEWVSLTGRPVGELGLWEPARVSFIRDEGGTALDAAMHASGLVVDAATWERVAAAADPAPACSATGWTQAHYGTTGNPGWWLLTPFTVLLDVVTAGSDDGDERLRRRRENRVDIDGVALP